MIHGQNHEMRATETKVFTVTNVYTATDGLVSFTSATISWILKSNSATITTKTVGSGITVSAAGVFTITLATGDTTGCSGEYRHECVATLADGTVAALFDGIITISPLLA